MPPKRFRKSPLSCEGGDGRASQGAQSDDRELDYTSAEFVKQPTKKRQNSCGMSQTVDNEAYKSKRSLPEIMAERRIAGLQTAISTENVGFKMLAKMGFNGQGGLGREGDGRATPLAISMVPGRLGLGVAEEERRREEEAVNEALRQSERLKDSWKAFQHDKNSLRHIRAAAVRAAKVIRNLDESAEKERNHLWPPFSCEELETESDKSQTFADSVGNVYSRSIESPTESASSNHQRSRSEDALSGLWEWESLTSTELLGRLLESVTYLRDIHHYCLLWACSLKDIDEGQVPDSPSEEVRLILEEE